MSKIRFALTLLLFVFLFSIQANSGFAAESCAQLLSGTKNNDTIIIPGAPADFQVISEGETIALYKGQTKLADLAREDSSAIASTLFDKIGNASVRGQGLRFGFSGVSVAEAANLMRNLETEGKRRRFGTQEGVVSASAGGGSGEPPIEGTGKVAASGEPQSPNSLQGSKNSEIISNQASNGGGANSTPPTQAASGGKPPRKFLKAFIGKDSSRRFDFTKATVTRAEDTATPIAFDGRGARFVQDFVVDVPSTPSNLDFFVRVYFKSKRSIEIETKPENVITDALHQTKLSNATLSQAANEIKRNIRSTDTDWNAAIFGADLVLVEIIQATPKKETS